MTAAISKTESKLKSVFDEINKIYGTGTIGQLGDMPNQEIEKISSGSLGIDIATGGGYPRGRIIEIYGPESSGKTTLTIHAIAEEQKAGGRVAFIDMEHAFDASYATALGVDISTLIFTQPSNGEEAFTVLEKLVGTGEVSLIIVDSVAAMVPKRELDGEIGDAAVGLHARLMSQGLRMITGNIKKTNTTVIFINQLRMKIGVMYGSPEVTTGGNSLKYYASVRLDVRKAEQVKSGEEVVANRTKVKVVKNKVAPPFKTAEFSILFGVGIDKISEVIDVCVEHDIVKKSGGWYAYGDTKLGNGINNVRDLLNDNPELFEELNSKAISILGK